MKQEIFQELVTRAIENLPDYFLEKLQNVGILIDDDLTSRQRLLGLYEGVPQTKRGGHYGLVPPDKITIFKNTIEAICKDDTEIISTIEKVIKHEIAHHFGISEARLRQIESGKN